MKKRLKIILTIVVTFSIIFLNFSKSYMVQAKDVYSEEINSGIKELLTNFFEMQVSKTSIDCSSIVNNPELAELYNLKFNDLVDSNKDKENMELTIHISSIENKSENSYIVKFSVTRRFNYTRLENKSEAKDNYTCEIQNLNKKLYINKLINDSNYKESLGKNNQNLFGNMLYKSNETPFDNYSDYLKKQIKSTKEFQAKEDELIAKLKTQKEDKSYKNGIMLRSYDGYNASAAVNYAHEYYDNYNPGYVAFDNDCQNFVSQAVHAGGVPMNEYWHHYVSKYYTYDVTPSWSVVQDFYTYIKDNGYTWGNDYYYNWRVGDVVQMFNDSTAHSVILTGTDYDGAALYSAHTNNRYNHRLVDGIKEGNINSWRYIKFWH